MNLKEELLMTGWYQSFVSSYQTSPIQCFFPN